jgi:hypothetical protein
MDLRKPKDEWSWEEDIPKLPKKLAHFVMEYVKHTKKIYVIGGKVGTIFSYDVNFIFYYIMNYRFLTTETNL